ncbi:MAG TPA: hypothetical protein VIH49_04360 [Solirubrobacteraceae bacterium]|nr:hypothetical protein [Solirubrobacteraceae bacterium]
MASADEPRANAGESAGHESASETELTAEALRRLQQRLDRASEAAERLIGEAAAAALRRPPAAGWQARAPEPEPEPEPHSGGRSTPASPGEIELLLDAVRALRERIPPELQRRLGEALREVLLALRALIDWYLERTEQRGRAATEIRDIPIV